jgi:hypothetical protein
MKVIAARGWLEAPDRTRGELTHLIDLLETDAWRAVGVLSEAKSVAVQTHARAMHARARDAAFSAGPPGTEDPAGVLHLALGLIPNTSSPTISLQELLVPLLRTALKSAKAPSEKAAELVVGAKLEVFTDAEGEANAAGKAASKVTPKLTHTQPYLPKLTLLSTSLALAALARPYLHVTH